jgi:DNA-binding MarR family transcriptional regulator
MAQLADYLGLERSSLSGLIDRAQARGLVERSPNPDDGRAMDVSLTDAGREIAQRLAASARVALAPRVAPLVAAERNNLCTLLTKSLND